jgi:hypothetical protein
MEMVTLVREHATVTLQPRNPAMPPRQSSTAVIVDLDEIGGLFGRSRWVIARWIRTPGLPSGAIARWQLVHYMGLIEAWTLERRARDPIVSQAAE